VHTVVKRHIFHPLFLSVPALRQLSSPLPGRVVARQLIAQLEHSYCCSPATRQRLPSTAMSSTPLHCHRAATSCSTSIRRCYGTFTSREYIDNLKSEHNRVQS
jgi:hypothetical protein